MPNIKSAKKRVLVTRKKAMRNQMRVSEMKTAIKKFDAALEAGDAKVIDACYKEAVHLVDQAAAKGNLKKNTAARRKSLLTRKLNAKKATLVEEKKPAKKAAAPKAEVAAEEKPAAKKPAAKKPAAKKPAAKKAEKKDEE